MDSLSISSSKCKWYVECDSKSNSQIKNNDKPEKILPNILHAIGNTPLVKLNSLPKSLGLKCDVFAKCEFLNPGGSVKDRISYHMILDAEAKGLLKPGYTVIEPTSGNTGIGLALVCSIKGYKCIIIMPSKMSGEKVDVMKALGAEVISTAAETPEELILLSENLKKATPNSIVVGQFVNPTNPLAHYNTTAQEIYDQCDGKIDMIVAGVGTGGTITGIGQKMKELCPNCVIVATDPEQSPPTEANNLEEEESYHVEGIGYFPVSTVLDRNFIDKWYKINHMESLLLARRLIKEEGLLCGGSSGAALSAVVHAAKDLKEGQRCVVILPDCVRNYMSKFLSDDWMKPKDLTERVNIEKYWWWNENVSKLSLQEPQSITPTASISLALDIMKKRNCNRLPVVDNEGLLMGMITMRILLNATLEGKIQLNESVNDVMMKDYPTITKESHLGRVSKLLKKNSFVVVVENKDVKGNSISGLITKMNFLDYIANGQKNLNGVAK